MGPWLMLGANILSSVAGEANKHAEAEYQQKLVDRNNESLFQNANKTDEAMRTNLVRAHDAIAGEKALVDQYAAEEAASANVMQAATGARGSGASRVQDKIYSDAGVAKDKYSQKHGDVTADYEAKRSELWSGLESKWQYAPNSPSELGSMLQIGGSALSTMWDTGIIS